MEEKNKISIIVPIYNSENSIKRCIDSLLRQTYENIEIILVNDGSTDGSEIICKSYNTNRIRYFLKSNGGVSSARNFGIERAKGDYILFVDSDDTIESNLVELMARKINDNNNILIGCRVKTIEGNKEKIEERKEEYKSSEFIIDILNNVISGYSWGFLFDKKKIGRFDEKSEYMEDTIFLIKYLKRVEQIKICDNYYNYIINNSSITKQKEIEKVKKNIININYSLNEIEKELQLNNLNINVHKLIIRKKVKIFESECSKVQFGNELIKMLDDNRVKEILEQVLCEVKDIKYNIFFKILLERKVVLLNFYLFIRIVLKKIKRSCT